MKRKRRANAVATAEYRLLLSARINEQDGTLAVVAELQTLQEFNSFRYEIVVQDTVEKGSVQMMIRGLRAPDQITPGPGPAIFRKEYDGLKGETKFVIRKNDGQETAFLVNVSKNAVTLKQRPDESFVEFVEPRVPPRVR